MRVSPLSPGTPGRTAAAHTIAGFTELLIEDAGDGLDSDSRAYLDRIAGGSRRMLEVVGGLTSYTSSHRTELDLRPLDTTALARGVAAGRLDAAAGPRPSVDVADLPPVMADPQLLGDVLGHLLDNALRFVRHGETPRVSVRAAAHSPGWVRVEVADHGIGVPDDQRDLIFRPFHRTPSADGYPGLGLGLATCARIIALHGGDLGVDPAPDGGSIFWFTVAATGVTLTPVREPVGRSA